MDVVQHHAPVPDPGGDGLSDGLGLLHDLLEHEVGVAALLGGGDIPVDGGMGLGRDGAHLGIEVVHRVCGEDGDLPVLQIDHVPGVLDDGRHVGGDEVPLRAEAQDQGALLPGGDEGVGVVRADDAEGVGALHPPQDPAHGLQHAAALLIVELQQLGHHLAVGLRGEFHPLAQQVFLDLLVVLDDAVVDQGHLAALAHMGMGVDVVGLAVGGPAGVADAQVPVEVRPVMAELPQRLQPALALADLQSQLLRPHSDAGGVIAPVLHPLQTIQQDGGGLLVLAHESDNSAHSIVYPPCFVRSR